MFKNREEAAFLLLKKLKKYKGFSPIIVGIPRGAMPMAKIIAQGLSGELNVILIHKIPAPNQEELAVGSVGLSGTIYPLPTKKHLSISEDYLAAEAARQVSNLLKRKRMLQPQDLKCEGKIVILVDDGIATGATAFGAIKEIQVQKPKKLVLAAAVVPPSTAKALRKEVDELIVLSEPPHFYSVSQFFENFEQVTDDQVLKILHGDDLKSVSL